MNLYGLFDLSFVISLYQVLRILLPTWFLCILHSSLSSPLPSSPIGAFSPKPLHSCGLQVLPSLLSSLHPWIYVQVFKVWVECSSMLSLFVLFSSSNSVIAFSPSVLYSSDYWMFLKAPPCSPVHHEGPHLLFRVFFLASRRCLGVGMSPTPTPLSLLLASCTCISSFLSAGVLRTILRPSAKYRFVPSSMPSAKHRFNLCKKLGPRLRPSAFEFRSRGFPVVVCFFWWRTLSSSLRWFSQSLFPCGSTFLLMANTILFAALNSHSSSFIAFLSTECATQFFVSIAPFLESSSSARS